LSGFPSIYYAFICFDAGMGVTEETVSSANYFATDCSSVYRPI